MLLSVRRSQVFRLQLFAMFRLELFFFRRSKSSVWGSSIVPVLPGSKKHGLSRIQEGDGREQSEVSDPILPGQPELYPSSQWHRHRDRGENRGQQLLSSRSRCRSHCEDG